MNPHRSTPVPLPLIVEHEGVLVVRDDLLPGGTKARFLDIIFEGADEVVYASPAEGGAQTALATVARQLGKRATIFVARRAKPHPRTIEAANLGASVVSVDPGYLSLTPSLRRQPPLSGHDSAGFNGQRIAAARWDASLPPAEAAKRASRAIGWPELSADD